MRQASTWLHWPAWPPNAPTPSATGTDWSRAATVMSRAHGVDVPLEDIARRAEVSIGTLYNNFPNRGALLDAALPDWASTMSPPNVAAADQDWKQYWSARATPGWYAPTSAPTTW